MRLDPRWLELLTAPLLAPSSNVDIVSGWFAADPQTPFERAMGATVLPALEDIDPATFLPSSRSVAFRKAAWYEVGGYPEWLDYSEDLVFDIALRDAGKQFVFAPGAVAHFRPRADLRAFYRQYYRYARGDGKANLWLKRHTARYATYAIGPAIAAWSLIHRSSMPGKAGLLAVLARWRSLLPPPIFAPIPHTSGLAAGLRPVCSRTCARNPAHRRYSQDAWLPCGRTVAAPPQAKALAGDTRRPLPEVRNMLYLNWGKCR